MNSQEDEEAKARARKGEADDEINGEEMQSKVPKERLEMAPIINVNLPSEDELEQARRFSVISNYVINIGEFISRTYAPFGIDPTLGLLNSQRSLQAYQRTQRKQSTDTASIKRHLWLSWGAEVQLRAVDRNQASFVRYANAWAPVHSYYAMYMASHALFAAMGMMNPPDDHTKSLNMLCSQVVERGLLPPPWDVSCTGCPQLRERFFTNLPQDAQENDHFEALASPEASTFWARHCKMLETTRRDRLEKTFGHWKQRNGRKNMRREEKRKEARRVPPTTLFDFFWRLRIRSNYRDIRSYLMSAVSDESHAEFHDNVLRVSSTTCLLLQSLVVRNAGKDVLAQAVEEFLGSGNVAELTGFIEVRRDALLS